MAFDAYGVALGLISFNEHVFNSTTFPVVLSSVLVNCRNVISSQLRFVPYDGNELLLW